MNSENIIAFFVYDSVTTRMRILSLYARLAEVRKQKHLLMLYRDVLYANRVILMFFRATLGLISPMGIYSRVYHKML